MADNPDRTFKLEGVIGRRVMVTVKGNSLEEAIVTAEQGDYQIVAEFQGEEKFSFQEETDVEVAEDGETFLSEAEWAESYS